GPSLDRIDFADAALVDDGEMCHCSLLVWVRRSRCSASCQQRVTGQSSSSDSGSTAGIDLRSPMTRVFVSGGKNISPASVSTLTNHGAIGASETPPVKATRPSHPAT